MSARLVDEYDDHGHNKEDQEQDAPPLARVALVSLGDLQLLDGVLHILGGLLDIVLD